MRSSAVRSPAQNRTLYGALGELARLAGLDADARREVLEAVTREVSGQEHSSRLTPPQAEAAIQRLRQRAAAYAPPPVAPVRAPRAMEGWGGAFPEAAPHDPWDTRAGPRPVETITPRMLALLQRAFRLAGMATPAQQRGFSERQCRKPWPQSQQDFDAVFEGCSAIALRRVRPREVWERVQRLHGHPGLNRWQKGFVADVLAQFSSADDVGRLDKVLTPGKLAKILEAEVACGIEG